MNSLSFEFPLSQTFLVSERICVIVSFSRLLVFDKQVAIIGLPI